MDVSSSGAWSGLIERGYRECGFGITVGGSLFKCRMISRESLGEFFAKGRIPNEFLKFMDVDILYLRDVFSSFHGPDGFPLCFEEQCTQNVLGVMR